MTPETMSAGQINTALDRLDDQMSAAVTALIDAGRGRETHRDIIAKDDPQSVWYRGIAAQQQALRHEISRRYGPGAPSRLPAGRGFGPIRTI